MITCQEIAINLKEATRLSQLHMVFEMEIKEFTSRSKELIAKAEATGMGWMVRGPKGFTTSGGSSFPLEPEEAQAQIVILEKLGSTPATQALIDYYQEFSGSKII